MTCCRNNYVTAGLPRAPLRWSGATVRRKSGWTPGCWCCAGSSRSPWYRPSAICWRLSGFLSHCSSCGLLRKEISASTDGMSAPIRTTNGALRTPRSRLDWLVHCLESESWIFAARSRDSSIFSLLGDFLDEVLQIVHRALRQRVFPGGHFHGAEEMR